MTDYFVGPGGNDADNGLTWATRKLTLQGAENVPVVAGDIIYVGPGVYRALTVLLCAVSGNAGNPITYIGDVTGENTDGVGGIVRLTASPNDQGFPGGGNTTIRILTRNYRTFRGFQLDLTDNAFHFTTGTNLIIEDCTFQSVNQSCIVQTSTGTDLIVRRCVFMNNKSREIWLLNAATIADANHLIENCYHQGHGQFDHVFLRTERIGGITIRDCSIYSMSRGIWVAVALAGGSIVTVNNCILSNMFTALEATAVGEIIENHNTFFMDTVNRVNTAVGANSLTYPPLQLLPILHAGAGQISGFKYPWWLSELNEWSLIRAITGANEPTEDLRGLIRPATAAKNSWGATQFFEMERATGTVRTGVSSMVLLDAGINQMFIPITAEEITVEVYVQREGAYAGVNPQMIIKQPGQADRVTLDAGAAGAWNLLTDTFTPAALPPYVIVEFVSNNTAVAGAFSTFFDDLEVS